MNGLSVRSRTTHTAGGHCVGGGHAAPDVRLLAFLPHQRRQSVRAANEIRGARRDDLLGTLDIADFVIDQRPVACLLWVSTARFLPLHAQGPKVRCRIR